MNRRDFIKVAGALVAGGTIPATRQEKERITICMDDSRVGMVAPAVGTLNVLHTADTPSFDRFEVDDSGNALLVPTKGTLYLQAPETLTKADVTAIVERGIAEALAELVA